jgi:hypothetical protein
MTWPWSEKYDGNIVSQTWRLLAAAKMADFVKNNLASAAFYGLMAHTIL